MDKLSNTVRMEAFVEELSEEERKRMERWAMIFSAIVGPLLIGTMAWFTIFSQ